MFDPNGRLTSQQREAITNESCFASIAVRSGDLVQILAQPAPVDASRIFAYDTTKPLNLTVGKPESATGVALFEISYDSPKGGRVYLVVPFGQRTLPCHCLYAFGPV